ncbi:dTDP-4-amino-4,6-dideoxy-D-glucose transaminase [Pseudoalteromonas sp. NC201]|nr:dTDP-4-amino-4,6-dideoxy-D-glucose transaminase [Pseudoalteromonas sp. NC201]
MIHVTSPYLPSMKKYIKYIEGIYERKWLTNNGPLVKELTARLEAYLGVKNLLLVSSGTMALQIAFRIKNLQQKNVISTPFTFQATYSALEWQGAHVDFCDIDSKTWNMDPYLLEEQLSSGKKIDCVVPVHTFGNSCEVEHLQKLQEKYKFSLIYDAAHALTTLDDKGKSILTYGDISCFSLHATKLFHTVEGGALVFKNDRELETAKQMINFGLDGELASKPGINGKLSEFHAAMGLAILDDLPLIEEDRARQKDFYNSQLQSNVSFQTYTNSEKVSPSYMPILFDQVSKLELTLNRMNNANIYPRRYFYPSLNRMPIVVKKQTEVSMPNAESVSQRILCLPLYYGQKNTQIEKICDFIP